MAEPDWNKFRIDKVWDPVGLQTEKVQNFMHAFIEWRAEEAAPPQPQPNINGSNGPRKKARRKKT